MTPLVVLFLVLPGRDGGSDLLRIWPLAAAALPAAVLAIAELRRLPRLASWLLLAWVGGLVLATAFGVHRSDAVDPLVGYLVAPVLLLAAHRIARRPWGLAALLVLIAISFGIYQYESWMAWWGWTGLGQAARWAPLSWWNPAATLMGMFAAFFFGLAMTAQRVLRVGFVALAASGVAGAWLTGSRAGFAAGVGGLVVAGIVGARSAGRRGDTWKAVAGTSVALVVLALLMTGGLSSMTGTSLAESQPTLARDQPVSGNAVFRVRTWGTALEMWAARPLTGHGVGSYAALNHNWARNDTILASSVHNEYLEVLAEAGPLPTAALVGVALFAAWLVIGLIRRPRPASDDPSDLTTGILAGAAGAAAVFFVHSGLDFDWEYAVVSGFAAVMTGVLIARRHPNEHDAPTVDGGAVTEAPAAPRTPVTLAATAAGLLTVALVVALAATSWELRRYDTEDPLVAAQSNAPWEIRPQLSLGRQAVEKGDYDLATTVLERPLTWSPADSRVDVFAAMARFFDGTMTAEEFAAKADQWPRWLEVRGRIAVALATQGAHDLAREVGRDMRSDLADYSAPRSLAARTELVALDVVLAHADAGCDAAVEAGNAGLTAEGLSVPAVVRLQEVLQNLDCPIPGQDDDTSDD